MKSQLSAKFIIKNMKLAKLIGEEGNSCFSRKIGTVIVDKNGVVLSTGYNSPPRKSPHCDSKEYIRDILWPKLNQGEKNRLASFSNGYDVICSEDEADKVPDRLDGCKQCPRKLLGYTAGEKSEYCSCFHSEMNCLLQARCDIRGGILLCWCKNLSCINCTSGIINSEISEVHFLSGGGEYHVGVYSLYEYAGIPVFLHDEREFEN